MALKKSIYKTICRKPFTSIPTKPTWSQKELFVEEAEHIRLEMSVSYTWVKDYGLLAEIHGAAKYLSNRGHNFVAPSQPPHMDPVMLIPGKTQIQIKIMQSAVIVAKRDYVVVMGFRRGISRNIHDALKQRYYEQMHEDIFKYKCVLPHHYIKH